MADWILHCLLLLVGRVYPTDGAVPPPSDLRDLAEGIDVAAHAYPLPGDAGVVDMAAEMAVLAVVEGHLRADAVAEDQFGVSYGPWQIHETTMRGYFLLGPSRIRDSRTASLQLGAELAAMLVKKSHEVCSGRPSSESLGWYASGGPTCSVPEGLAASRYRTGLARWVRARNPVYWVDRTR